MNTSLDCIPCLVRQVLDATRRVSADPVLQTDMVREMLRWASKMDLDQPPPVLAQRLHRRLREVSGVADPYLTVKASQNCMAMAVATDLRVKVRAAQSPLTMAVRLAIAGNVIDLGAKTRVTKLDVLRAVEQALAEPVYGELEQFRRAAGRAGRILYLADNAGEIFFDRLLVEALSPQRVTLAVRGAPVLNDATAADARAAGLAEICEVIDNGSDAPGTLLEDCSRGFRQRFSAADMIIAKGQGNYETLSEAPGNIFFLFKVKCPVIAAHTGMPEGAQVLARKPTKKSTAHSPAAGLEAKTQT
ncbi:MAG: ARMT1-like domain-containing protein [Desulfobacterales bacterium]